jgi:hypothetical protein
MPRLAAARVRWVLQIKFTIDFQPFVISVDQGGDLCVLLGFNECTLLDGHNKVYTSAVRAGNSCGGIASWLPARIIGSRMHRWRRSG